MHWRTKEGLILLKNTVEKSGGVQFSPDIIRAAFTMKMEWYKYGKPIFDAFVAQQILIPLLNDYSKTTGYVINLQKIKEEGIEIEGYLMQIYFDKIKEMEEKQKRESEDEVARIAHAKPEGKK